MQYQENVFQKTYNDYLDQIRAVSFASLASTLGIITEETKIKIPLFNIEYSVSCEEITDPFGKKPTHDICVILSKYILLCPDTEPKSHDLVSYRNFKDSNPLVSYFKNEVEEAISSYFSERLNDLKKAGDILGGSPATLDLNCDIAIQFDALPKIPLILLFNNADEEFPAKCSVMFESQAESYLDAESLAMLGRLLFSHLKKVL